MYDTGNFRESLVAMRVKDNGADGGAGLCYMRLGNTFSRALLLYDVG